MKPLFLLQNSTGLLGSLTYTSVWYGLAIVACSALIIKLAPESRAKVRNSLVSYILSLFFLLASFLTRGLHIAALQETLLFLEILMIGISVLNLFSIFIFDLALPRINVVVPRILSDTLLILVFLAGGLWLLKQRGVNISGLITTSAVLTAVIGLSLQDTLGNIIAGLSLQMENEIKVGDWIKIDQYVGRVKDIRWRRTSIETRNWETILVPNSQLVKGSVTIYGRREGENLQTRRWIYFNVDLKHSPTEVIECVNKALQLNVIEGVASQPPIHAILMDFKEGFAQYAVRYWLTNIAADDPTDSIVRTRIYFALKREGMSLALPTHKLNVTEEKEKVIQRKKEKDLAGRVEALKKVELFKSINEEELTRLAMDLKYAPFGPGETLTRQGAEGHWLYIITEGEVSVTVNVNGVDKEVNRLHAGQFFGEMSLMTGQPRTATVTSIGEVDCYRLDKESFQKIVKERPEIAEDLAEILALRKLQYDAVFQTANLESKQARVNEAQMHILRDIRNFFGL